MRAYKVWTEGDNTVPERYFTTRELAEAFAQIFIDPPNITEIEIEDSFMEAFIIKEGWQAYDVSIAYDGSINYSTNSTLCYVYPPSEENTLEEIDDPDFKPIDYNPFAITVNAKSEAEAVQFARDYRDKLIEKGKWIWEA